MTVQTENVAIQSDRVVIVLTIPKGQDKPYFDRNGVIWLKSGADTRRVNSKEELRRLFQSVDQFHADELPTKAGIDRLDRLRFRDFLRDFYQQPYPETPDALRILLQNMNLATDDGMLNLAGVLLFAERPERIKPQFIVKAIRYPGNIIHSTEYVDTEDFTGPLSEVFAGAMAFVMRNLHKIQAGQGVNAPGSPEIPAVVFEELLVNALAHRDYLITAPIRVFVYDNRIEIISPGHLPNNLTIAKIRAGNSNIRNPILVSYIAKGLLPYRGLGSGIKRALENWPAIDFTDDRDGSLFTVTVHRLPANDERDAPMTHSTGSQKPEPGSSETQKSSQKSSQKRPRAQERSQKSSQKIIELVRRNPKSTIAEMAGTVGISERAIKRQIDKLGTQGRIQRIGPDKGGHWQLID